VFFAPFPEEEISDYIAHGPIIRVLTVLLTVPPLTPLGPGRFGTLSPPHHAEAWAVLTRSFPLRATLPVAVS